MKLTSHDFKNGDFLLVDFTCQGKGIAPVLQIADAPASTTVFALIANDPDAPGGSRGGGPPNRLRSSRPGQF